MKKAIAGIFFLLSIFWAGNTFAQGWVWGRGASRGTLEGWTVATDPLGNVYSAAWAETIGPIDFGPGVSVTTSGGSEVVWVKYNSTGAALWAGNIDGLSELYNITTDPAGNLILFGSFPHGTIRIGSFTLTNATALRQFFLAKIDPSGTVLWAVNDGNAINGGWLAISSAIIMSEGGVATDAAGNIFITSSFATSSMRIGATTLTNAGVGYDIFLAKYSSAGAPLWARSIGGTGNDYGFGVAAASNGNIYVTGAFYSHIMPVGSSVLVNSSISPGYPYAYLAKFSAAGVPLWGQGEGGMKGAFGTGLAKDNYGHIYMTGGFNDTSIAFGSVAVTRTYPAAVTHTALFLVQYSSSDIVTWHKTIGAPVTDLFGFCIAMASCGEVWVSGVYHQDANVDGHTLRVVSGTDPVFIAGYDLGGGVVGYGGLGSGGDDQNGIACDGYGNVFISSDFSDWPYVIGPDMLSPTDVGEYHYVGKFENTPLPPDTSYSRKDTTVCALAGVSGITLSGRPEFTNFYWDNASTEPTRIVSASGTYFVYNISCGATVRIDTFHVTFVAPLDSTHAYNVVSGCGALGDTLSAPPGHTAFSWSTGSFDPYIFVTASGTYIVKAISGTPAGGCHLLVDTFHVLLLPPGDTAYWRKDTSQCAAIHYVTLSGERGYSAYSWSTGSTDPSIMASTAGIYILKEVSAGCDLTVDTFHFTIRPNDSVFVHSDSSKCGLISSMTLVSPPGYLTHLWSGGGTGVSIVASAPGAYILYAGSGCAVLVDTFHVTFNPDPVVYLGNDTGFCTGGTLALTSVQPAGYTYLWSTGSTASSITVTTAGAYWLRVTSPGGCKATDTVRVSVYPPPVVITGPDHLCAGNTITLADATTGGAWSSHSASIATVGSSSGLVAGVAGGVTTISYSTGVGCYSIHAITVNPLPAAFSLGGGGSYCAGWAGWPVVLSGSESGIQYQLFNDMTSIGSPLAGTGATLDFGIQTISAIYKVVATNAVTGCSRTMTDSVMVTVSSIRAVASSRDTIVCATSDYYMVVLTATGGAGYTWNDSSTGATLTINSTGTYWVAYADTPACSFYSDTIHAVFSPVPVAITGRNIVCVGDTVILSDMITGGTWSSESPAIASVMAGGVVTGNIAGTDTVVYTTAAGCSTKFGITVINPPCETGVTQIAGKHDVEVIPNPNKGEFVIETGNIIYESLTITNAIGQQLLQQPVISATTKVEVPMLPAGLYYLTIRGKEGNVVRKFVKL